MFLSKNAKRFMSTAAVLAMTVASLVVAPKVEAAEGDEPTVKVLGASLRIKDNAENCQSMRIGIQVKNASKAQACGIKLSIGSGANKKEAIVSTENGHNNIYNKNETKDTVVYTAVIKDIPKGNFATEITAQGITKAVGSDTEITTDISEGKTVNGIANEMAKNSNITMLDDGTLVKEVKKLDVSSANNVKPFGTVNDFYSWNFPAGKDGNLGPDVSGDAQVVYDSTEKGLKVTTDSTSGKGLVYQTTAGGDLIYQLQFKADASQKIKLMPYFGTDAIGGKEISGTGNWETLTVRTTLGAYGACAFGTSTGSGEFFVKAFSVYQALADSDLADIVPADEISVPLSGATFDGDCGTYDATTNTISVNDAREDGDASSVIYIPLPETVAVGKSVKITVSGTQWGNNDFRIWTTPADGLTSGNFVENSNVFLSPTVNEDGSFSGTVNLVAKGKDCDHITLKPTYGIKIKGLVISDIKMAIS